MKECKKIIFPRNYFFVQSKKLKYLWLLVKIKLNHSSLRYKTFLSLKKNELQSL